MAEKYVTSILLAIGEMQIKKTMIQLSDQSQKVKQCYVEMWGHSKAHSQLLRGQPGSLLLESYLLYLVTLSVLKLHNPESKTHRN